MFLLLALHTVLISVRGWTGWDIYQGEHVLSHGPSACAWSRCSRAVRSRASRSAKSGARWKTRTRRLGAQRTSSRFSQDVHVPCERTPRTQCDPYQRRAVVCRPANAPTRRVIRPAPSSARVSSPSSHRHHRGYMCSPPATGPSPLPYQSPRLESDRSVSTAASASGIAGSLSQSRSSCVQVGAS